MPIHFADLKPDDEFLQALPYGVWLMDNHKWALSVWARHHTGPRRWLFHADHHWDGVDLFREDNQAQAALQAADTNTLDQWIRDENLIQYDAFIAPAVRKGLFEEIHFFCTQSDDWDKGLDPALCEAMGVVQTMHVDIDSFARVTARAPIVFDLCLDLFNEAPKFYGSDLWSESAIVHSSGLRVPHKGSRGRHRVAVLRLLGHRGRHQAVSRAGRPAADCDQGVAGRVTAHRRIRRRRS
jgi:hypothetical protein